MSHRRPFVPFILVLLAGCEDGRPVPDRPTAVLEGTVTVEGARLHLGNFGVVSEDGKYSRATRIGPDGRFRIPEAPVGKVKAFVTVPAVVTAKGAAPLPKTAPNPAPLQKEAGALAGTIPVRYREADKSGLTFEVKTGDNHWDVRLTKK